MSGDWAGAELAGKSLAAASRARGLPAPQRGGVDLTICHRCHRHDIADLANPSRQAQNKQRRRADGNARRLRTRPPAPASHSRGGGRKQESTN